MTYLTRGDSSWERARLARISKGVAEIASEVGYESESAVHRAFKREFGLPPAQYRREQGTAPPPKCQCREQRSFSDSIVSSAEIHSFLVSAFDSAGFPVNIRAGTAPRSQSIFQRL